MGLEKPMEDMNRRNEYTEAMAEGMLTGDPIAYYRRKLSEKPPVYQSGKKKGMPKKGKKFDAWLDRQKSLRQGLVSFINKQGG